MTDWNRATVDMLVPAQVQKTVVCVTDQRECDRIITAGRTLADMTGTELTVLHITHPQLPPEPDTLEYLFGVSTQNNAEMTWVYSTDVAKALIRYLKENKINYVLTGIPQEGDSVVTKLWKKFTHITFFVVEDDGALREVGHPARAAQALCDASI